jgi:hypothetical protein
MPIKLADIVNKTVPCQVVLDAEDTINLTIRRNFYTPAVSATLQSSADPMGAEIDLVVGGIVDWDVLGDDGSPVPITSENLSQLSISVINSIYSAMMAAVRPNPEKANS